MLIVKFRPFEFGCGFGKFEGFRSEDSGFVRVMFGLGLGFSIVLIVKFRSIWLS